MVFYRFLLTLQYALVNDEEQTPKFITLRLLFRETDLLPMREDTLTETEHGDQWEVNEHNFAIFQKRLLLALLYLEEPNNTYWQNYEAPNDPVEMKPLRSQHCVVQTLFVHNKSLDQFLSQHPKANPVPTLIY